MRLRCAKSDMRSNARSFVEKIGAALEDAVGGSRVSMLGSLAAGTADEWSDIDIRWDVPDAQFEYAVEGARDAFRAVRPRCVVPG